MIGLFNGLGPFFVGEQLRHRHMFKDLEGLGVNLFLSAEEEVQVVQVIHDLDCCRAILQEHLLDAFVFIASVFSKEVEFPDEQHQPAEEREQNLVLLLEVIRVL